MARLLVDLETTVAVLRDGGVVLLPTDTLPGLHCRGDLPAAVTKLRALKGRHEDKPLLLLCADVESALEQTSGTTAAAREEARRLWPGPFTCILPTASTVGSGVTAGAATVALRVPGREDLRELIAAAGAPLVSTSANLAGQPPLTDLAGAAAVFGYGLDGVTGDWLPQSEGACASALIDLCCEPPRVLREGPIAPF